MTPTLKKLHEEAAWELTRAIDAAAIKLHSFTSRVKSEASFLDKVDRKGYTDPWSQTEDFVGLRAVCLFRTDLRRLEDVVRSCFTITSTHDTVEGVEADSFGYMSVHLNAQIHPDRAGPRYEDIKNWTFEVQLRTILMDAWDNVSHYLEYKGESSIPSPLRRDFYALSGLFYVADKHFELFFAQSQHQREETVASLSVGSSDLDVEINLDTLLGFLAARFPDRKHSDTEGVSELVEELVLSGYQTLIDVDEMYKRAEQAGVAYETKHPPAVPSDASGAPRFMDVGVIRTAFTIADPRVRATRQASGTLGDLQSYLNFESLVRPVAT